MTVDHIYIRTEPEFKRKMEILASIKGQTVAAVTRQCFAKWIEDNAGCINEYTAGMSKQAGEPAPSDGNATK